MRDRSFAFFETERIYPILNFPCHIMKLIDRAIAILVIFLVSGAAVPAVRAQKLSNQSVPPASIDPENNGEEENSPQENDRPYEPSEENSGLSLLGKSIFNYVKGAIYRTESELELNASNNSGDIFNITGKITAITQYPHSYRIDFTFFKADGTPGNRYLLISNGKDVWLYQPDSQQYLVTSVTDFERSDDSWIIGFANLFYLNTPEQIKQEIDRDSISDRELAQTFLTSTGSSLQQEIQEIAGDRYNLYQFIADNQSLQFSFLVGENSEQISQFQTQNQDRDITLSITEKIVSREENPSIDNNTFNFLPPTSATQVDSLSVEPF